VGAKVQHRREMLLGNDDDDEDEDDEGHHHGRHTHYGLTQITLLDLRRYVDRPSSMRSSHVSTSCY
jgi:hypothetical protein